MSMRISVMGVSPLPSPAVTFSFCPLFQLVKISWFSARCLVRANSCLSPKPHFPACHQVPSWPPSKEHWQVAVVFQSDSEMVIHTFIMARLDYCNSLLAAFPKGALHKLQMVWNMASRIRVKKGQYHPFCWNLYLGNWLDSKLISNLSFFSLCPAEARSLSPILSFVTVQSTLPRLTLPGK